jgi:hypothetical protein
MTPATKVTPGPLAAATFTRTCKCTPGAPGTVTFSYDDAVPSTPVTAACSKCSTTSLALKIQSGFQP